MEGIQTADWGECELKWVRMIGQRTVFSLGDHSASLGK